MKANYEIAKKLGHIKCKPRTLIDIREVNKYKPEQILIICTGAQGEENAMLNKIISKTDRNIRLTPQDNIIFSSSVIPGNEMAVQNLKDNISKQGAKLFHYKMLDIHASGHAHKEELKLFLNLINPKNVMPIHGYFYMQKIFGDLIQETLPLKEHNCIIASNGQVIEMRNSNVQVTQKFVPASYVMVDGLGIGDVGEVIMKDRNMLADDGIFIANILINKESNKIKLIEVVSRGFIVMKESRSLIDEAKQEIQRAIEKEVNSGTKPNDIQFKKNIKDKITSFLVKKTERNPIVVTLITII
jgi:ribonuclease J